MECKTLVDWRQENKNKYYLHCISLFGWMFLLAIRNIRDYMSRLVKKSFYTVPSSLLQILLQCICFCSAIIEWYYVLVVHIINKHRLYLRFLSAWNVRI